MFFTRRRKMFAILCLVLILIVGNIRIKRRADSGDISGLRMQNNIENFHINDWKMETFNNHRQPGAKFDYERGNAALSGAIFTGQKIRNFPPHRRNYNNMYLKPTTDISTSLTCSNWGVLTTILEPTEAVRQFLFLHNWCLVVVGDRRSPAEYNLYSSRSNVLLYLSLEDQRKLQSAFVNSIPSSHFGRKNIGYIYAMLHGAEVIWDFDDDNMLKFWMKGAATDSNLWIETFITKIQPNLNVLKVQKRPDALFFNPYPYLGAPDSTCWPRGYPLSLVHESSTFSETFNDTVIEKKQIAILQSLADHQPDVDAIYRMTYKTPFYFKRTSMTNPIVLPHGIYSPLNAQATLHFKAGFFALFLPVTVHGRVSDIWRSYIAQTLFSLRDLHVGFLPRALVHQNRNPHSYEADFQGELQLYLQSNALVKFLDSWKDEVISKREHKKRSIEDLMENLYIDLYERGFVEEQDVVCVQLWLELIAHILPSDSTSETKPLSVPFKWTQKTDAKPIITKEIKQGNNYLPANSKTFWTPDVHNGTRIDIATTLSHLGQTTYIASRRGSTTPYPHVLEMPGIHFCNNISRQNREYEQWTQVSQSMIDDNVRFYKDNIEFRKANAVFCLFPTAKCEYFMPFNQTKSILFIAGHRYNIGRCDKRSWSALNSKLKQLHDMERRHVIGANNRYDLEYLRHYTGLERLELIPSSTLFYIQNPPVEYTHTNDELLFFYKVRYPNILRKVTAFKYAYLRDRYPNYTLKDLANHRGFIMFPYSVMSYKTAEIYALSIPMFVPSFTYFQNVGGFGDGRAATSPWYCLNKNCFKWRNMQKSPNSYHTYNPNVLLSESPEDEMYWLQFSDFYEWPHIQYFDNVTDLEQKVSSTDFLQVHYKMKEENEIRKKLIVNQWKNIVKSI